MTWQLGHHRSHAQLLRSSTTNRFSLPSSVRKANARGVAPAVWHRDPLSGPTYGQALPIDAGQVNESFAC